MSDRINEIAQRATVNAWHKVNHRIISFESFEKAIKPEIVTAIKEAMPPAPYQRMRSAGCGESFV